MLPILKEQHPLCWSIMNCNAGIFPAAVRNQVRDIKESLEVILRSKDEMEIGWALAWYEVYLTVDYFFLNFLSDEHRDEYKKRNKSKTSATRHRIYIASADMLNRFPEPLEELDKRDINWKGA